MLFLTNSKLINANVNAYISEKNKYFSVILSAAHCISSYMMATAGGSHLSDNTTQTVDIQSTFLHENYLQDPNGIQTYNDIGLLLLKNPFQFNSHIQRIELTNKIDFHRNVTVYGWGSTDAFVINRSEHLRAKNISLIPVDVCNKMLNEAITTCEKQIYEYCVEKSCCNGDSGGPVVQTIGNVTKLVGIISWGADDDISCDSEPHVFDSVGYFAKWIKNGIRTLLREKVSGSGDDQENFVKH